MENENNLGRTSGEPLIDAADKIILNKDQISFEDIKTYLQAHLAFTQSFLHGVGAPARNFVRLVRDREYKAIKDWETSRYIAVDVLLYKIFSNRRLGVETTANACRKCLELILSKPIVVSKEPGKYKTIIREAEVMTERARGDEFFPVHRAIVAALEFNAEKFTLLYGRANRTSRLQRREAKFNGFLEELMKVGPKSH